MKDKNRRSGHGHPTRPAAPPPRALTEAVQQHLRHAVALHQQGRLAEAEAAYRSVLDSHPQHPDALHLSGVLALQTGQAERAVDLIRQAIVAQPNTAEFHDNLGSALAALGQHDRAVPAHATALRHRPDFAKARYNLGNALAALGRHPQAAGAFMSAVVVQPDYARAWFNLGNQFRVLQHGNAAANAFAHCLALTPTMAEAHTNLGEVLSQLGRLEEAVAQHRLAVALLPDSAMAHYNLGAVLQRAGRFEEAELVYRGALRRNPRHAGAWNNLGSVLRRLGHPHQAIQCHRNALVFSPEFIEAYYNLGNALHKTGHLQEAEKIFANVLARDPDMATATHNLGLLSLIRGDLTRGWEGLERRFAAREAKPDRKFSRPRWQGQPLTGQRLMVWREQGIGDEIMTASCYGHLATLGGSVIVETEPRLVSLMARSFPRLSFRAESCDGHGNETIDPPDYDYQIPAGSLPRLLRRHLSDFPPAPRWLVPDPVRQARWRTRVNALGRGLKVGICWRSQLRGVERDPAYVMLPQWGPLFAVAGVHLINLQYDDCDEEIADAESRFGKPLHRWDDLDLKNDFEATAAMLSNLDLVITVATSAGELAAALGIPVWRMGGTGDWSCLGTGCRPWYPTMRLWLSGPGDTLPDLIPKVARALEGFAAANPTAKPGEGANPDAPDADKILMPAIAAHKQGDFARAAIIYGRTLAIDPSHADALHLLGLVRHQQGDSRRGARLVRRALAVDPLFDFAANNLGLIRQALKREADAHNAFRTALGINPTLAEAVSHLGVNLQHGRHYRDAAVWHRRAVQLTPANPNFHNNLGATLERAGNFTGAEARYRIAVALAPGQIADVLNNLGTMARQRGDDAGAVRWLDRTLTVSPGFPLAEWNRGLIALAQGDLRRGWRGYDRRFASDTLQPPRLIDLPVWRGEPLAGRRLLIWAEQGVGDELMYATCLPRLPDWLATRHGPGHVGKSDGTIVVECDPRLVDLLARALPWAEVRATAGQPGGPEERQPSDCHLQLPMGSLPPLLHPDIASFTRQATPLLTPLPVPAALWRQRLAELPPGIKVGIAWKSMVVDAYRRTAYTTLADWLPVLQVPGVIAVNLQYGDCADEIAAVAGPQSATPLHCWPDLDIKDDFESVAALVANLDLVICTATSAGELAGALGVPVWRICGPDWTQLGTAVRPWYPDMALFQPSAGGSLSNVIATVARRLQQFRQTANQPRGELLHPLPG